MAQYVMTVKCGDKNYHISVSGKDVYYSSGSKTGGMTLKGVKCYNNELRNTSDNKPITELGICLAIKKSTSSSGCFITTAVCENLGKKDNCNELQILRKFRDEYLLNTSENRTLVEDYYKISPKLIQNINSSKNKMLLSKYLLDNYINVVIDDIKNEEYKNAVDNYIRMINYLDNLSID